MVKKFNTDEEKDTETQRKVPDGLIVVIEKQPDEPAYRTKRIMSQNDVMAWINGRKKWIDFPEYQEE
ncbi:hypothetical protein DSECCO2_655650 [anaerobic digester metagenome]